MPDWWDQQGVPPGGAVAPIEDGYSPYPTRGGGTGLTPEQVIAAAEGKRQSPDYVSVQGGGAGYWNGRMPNVSLDGATGGALPGGRPGTPGGGGTGGAQYSDDALQAILHKYPPTNDGMRAAMAEVERTFGAGVVQLLEHPERLDKLVTPTGTWDTIGGAGGTNPSWVFNRDAHSPGGGYAPGSFGSLVAGPMDGKAMVDDPAYQFRMKEGAKVIERSAAAKGTLLTGKTAKDLTRWGQDYAANEYQNSWNRNFNQQGAVFNRLFQTAGLGSNSATAAGQLASGYANNAGNLLLGQGQTQAGTTVANANNWGQTIGSLANLYGQYAGGRAPADPNNTGNYLDVGRGLY